MNAMAKNNKMATGSREVQYLTRFEVTMAIKNIPKDITKVPHYVAYLQQVLATH